MKTDILCWQVKLRIVSTWNSSIRGLPLPCSFSVYKQKERRMVDAPWRHPSLYFDLPIPKLFSYRARNTTHQSSLVFKLQSEQARVHSTSNTLLFLLPHVTHVSSGSRNCNNINLSFARELRVSPAKMVGEKITISDEHYEQSRRYRTIPR